MSIKYQLNPNITSLQFGDILHRSTLGKRRPIDDETSLEGMLEHADILVTAVENETIVGIARSVTDFHYCCYLSDLAVDKAYQNQGIAQKLITMTQDQLHKRCKIILLSAPNAIEYYPKIGFTQHPSAWTLPRDKSLPKQ